MPAQPSFRHTSHVLGLVTLVGRLVQDWINTSLQPLELTYAQAVALVRLWRSDNGELLQSHLIESLAVSRASGSQVLADLERRGLIGKRVFEADARQQIVHLTEQGRSLEPEVLPIFDDVEAALLAETNREERETAHSVLQSMLRSARARSAGEK